MSIFQFFKTSTAQPTNVDDNTNPLPVTLAGAGGSVVSTNITQVGGTAVKAGPAAQGQIAVTLYDSSGNEIVQAAVVQVNTEGQKATYSGTMIAQAAAANATDIFTITGSATKTVRVLRVGVSGIATAVGTQVVNLIKRSTANTAGTSAGVTAVSHDSTNAAASATVLQYSANPTLGTAVGTVRSAALPFGAAAAVGGGEKEWNFSDNNDQAIVLRGTSQVLALNLNAAIIAGATVTAWVEWTEE
jgi:hypothetical protein